MLSSEDVLEALGKVTVWKPSGHDRRANVLRHPDDRYRQMTLGLVYQWNKKRKPGYYPSQWTLKWPELADVIFRYGSQRTNKTFTSCTINVSYAMAKHKDKNNNGKSYIFGLGNYTGGELAVWESENGSGDPVFHDIRTGVCFDGSWLCPILFFFCGY